MTAPAAFLVQKIGPYHEARLRALGASLRQPLVAIEFRADDGVYAWQPVEDSGAYRRVCCTAANLVRTLHELHPSVVICVGYSDPEIHRAAAWASQRRIPLVTCSDSTAEDSPRVAIREWLKRCIVSAFDTALVAGSRADAYLDTLGVPAGARYRPWDVVDNDHFERGAEAARRAAPAERARLGLPGAYFLCVARFVEKKNLAGLIDAYSRYIAASPGPGWSLVLSGSGPLESALRHQAEGTGVGARVHFPGFLQYADLPACYGLAGAFVLPSRSDQWGLVVNEAMAAGVPVIVSTRCGCAPDLVREGETGFVIDPDDAAGFAAQLARVAAMSDDERRAMGQRGRTVVSGYSPAAFARGLSAAVSDAFLRRRPAAGVARRGLLRLLAARTA